MLLWNVPAVLAATLQLPETGQTTCYDTYGAVVSCIGSGQDGAKKFGAAWPSPRFVDNGNGTVTDNLTGLIWLKKVNCSATLGGVVKTETSPLTWASSIIWSNSLATGSCGLSDDSAVGDWRLPNRKELYSLINVAQGSSAAWLNGYFTGVLEKSYWSSTTDPVDRNYAVSIHMRDGVLDAYDKSDRNYFYVWPVRGGQ